MSPSALPPEIRNLPVPERVALVEQIWDSIAEDQTSLELTEAQNAELTRRLELEGTEGFEGSEWADVKRRILRKSRVDE